ncbi:Endonuclease V [bacterium HR36]|nr:Endonuclease V [bacterium HR36]
MNSAVPHPWTLTPREAIALQKELASQVQVTGKLSHCRYVAGADVAYTRSQQRLVAAVVLWDIQLSRITEYHLEKQPVEFPYVPGLLSFRESPAVFAAFGRLSTRPDLLIVDGHGYAHPRRFGIACHLGVLLDIPTIGCAKSILVGEHQPVPDCVGAWVPLLDHGTVIGAAVRTRLHVRPVYVSIGHKRDLEEAIRWILQCSRGCRLPEPTRQAHILVTEARQSGSQSKKPN